MVAVPADTGVTTPVLPMVAIPVALLLQAPPGVASVSVIVAPIHTPVGPQMAAAAPFTVTIIVVLPAPVV